MKKWTEQKSPKILEKINSVNFEKLEILCLNKAGINSIDFLVNNDKFKSLIIIELKDIGIKSL